MYQNPMLMGPSAYRGIMGIELVGEVLILVASILLAFHLNRRAQKSYPDRKPFVWGYIQALEMMLNAVLGLLLGMMLSARLPHGFGHIDAVMALMIGIPVFVLGLLMLKRNRVALVVATVVSSNPALWIINFFYLKNRWDELGKQQPGEVAVGGGELLE